ncbi:GNAT family N-acetyltransferase [Nissabacter sp. SGAir0207]|uniref:GNAT family N-acetyltransferase n=1 Tax=Nissabacter sp. SGAir0207 TaxID=2126321 RepID=UPI0010CD11DD|nr:GNAT family N-acetyltransferase [Nissabacter sp. SGAir0207]QCR38629.1 hypothetical protein C1N62_21020 [Nissabacter sp. SGAir0207]
MQLSFQPFDTKYYNQILTIIIDTWGFESWVPEGYAYLMAEYFLADMLSESSNVTLALKDDEVVGISGCSLVNDANSKSFLRKKQILSLMSFISDDNAHSHIFRQFMKTRVLSENMLLAADVTFEAVVNVLVVKTGNKGCGIGSKLYNLMISYFKQNSVQSFYLFSDSASDISFYERKGLKRVFSGVFDWGSNDPDNSEKYYLYAGKVEEL